MVRKETKMVPTRQEVRIPPTRQEVRIPARITLTKVQLACAYRGRGESFIKRAVV